MEEKIKKDKKEWPLAVRIAELSEGAGAQREDLYDFLGPELRYLWGIAGEHTALAATTYALKAAITAFPSKANTPDSHKRWLSLAYNIDGEFAPPSSTRADRQRWFNDNVDKQNRRRVTLIDRTAGRWIDEFALHVAKQLEPRRLELAAQKTQPIHQIKQAQPLAVDEPEPSTEPPTLTPALKDLLTAQAAAAAELGLSDPQGDGSSSVTRYVELFVRPPEDSSFGEDQPLSHCLKQDAHIAIQGKAGAGKSTLATQTVAHMARELLAGDHIPADTWLPLYIPARLLSGPGGFAAKIAAALAEHLAGLLMESPAATLFAEPPPGMQGWLVFVDGTDELAKGDARSALVATLNHQSTSAHFRFVVLGRSVEPRLAMPDLKTYEIAPFDDWQLSEFCRSWMRAQELSEFKAYQLLQQAKNRGIYSLLQNPLLATMLCQVYRSDPGGEVPRTLLALYEGFVKHLLFGRPAQSHIRRQMQTTLEQYGTLGDQLASWLYDNRRQICTRVAEHVIKGSGEKLLGVAAEYVKDVFPEFANHSDPLDQQDWQSLMHDVLLSTGFFVQRGPELAVMQRSLMEYLASEKEDTEEVSMYIDEPGEWYLFQMGDDLDNFANLCVLRWADSATGRQVIRNLLGPGQSDYARKTYPIVRHTIADLLSYSDVTLDVEMAGHIADLYNGRHKILSNEEYLIGLGGFYRGVGFDPDGLEQDVNAILGRFAPRYPRLAQLLYERTRAKQIWYPAILDGLAWLRKTRHADYAERELRALLDDSNPKKWLDAADVYLASGSVTRALEISRRRFATAEHMWRSAEITYNCGETAEALERLEQAFWLCRDWELRTAVARALAHFGQAEHAEWLLRDALSRQPVELRNGQGLLNLTHCGFGDLAEAELSRIIAAGTFHTKSGDANDEAMHHGPANLDQCRYAPGCRPIVNREMFSADFTRSPSYSVRSHWNFVHNQVIRGWKRLGEKYVSVIPDDGQAEHLG